MRYHGKHKKILVLLGHPDADSFCGSLASRYAAGATAAGHSVKTVHVGSLAFDPILHKGYKVIQELEPPLRQLQEDIRWCDHFVVVYPNWWSTMPALLKGLFDRMWLPGFAFRYRKGADGSRKLGWDRLLTGKTGRVIVTAASHPFLIWCMFGDFTNEISRGILWFAGIKNRVTVFGPAEAAPDWKRDAWLKKVERMGAHGK